ncbi:NAD(P)-binding protein [Diplogelasinospora grovesii]|uniref:NAD(P)-binding protein n=1 Tax=Diplogelasinospora grovesii TaxID=303347 RepID=A0AAN6NB38_9PEZI|nr:NAD(P)-binding protein [Diplogelasinospora grovesii]
MAQNPNNRVERVAIVGAGGNVGKPIAAALLATGRHTVTALTRAGSDTSSFPSGLLISTVNYDDPETIVAALKGQQFLVITLSVHSPPDTHRKICDAAAAAGVKYVMPNYWGEDLNNTALNADMIIGETYKANIADVERHAATAGMSWVALVCGTWYEYSLSLGPDFYGFDMHNKTATFYDDGTAKINTTTWAQCGRAVAAFLDLPEHGEGGKKGVSDWANKGLYVSSFRVSQRDMLDSLNRVMGLADADWKIAKVDAKERHYSAKEAFFAGDMRGLGRAMYARIFWPNAEFKGAQSADGDYETPRGGLDHKVLGLPEEEEDLDEATKLGVDMALGGFRKVMEERARAAGSAQAKLDSSTVASV